jgi:hypothetical protein
VIARSRCTVRAIPAWSIGVVATWLVLVGLAAWLSEARGMHPPTCMFRLVSGYPCPTCGSTRAGLAILRGDLATALAHNPLITSLPLLVAIATVWRLGTGSIPTPNLHSRSGLAVSILAAAALAANWAYVLATDTH